MVKVADKGVAIVELEQLLAVLADVGYDAHFGKVHVGDGVAVATAPNAFSWAVKDPDIQVLGCDRDWVEIQQFILETLC